jgi:hypothetical protein
MLRESMMLVASLTVASTTWAQATTGPGRAAGGDTVVAAPLAASATGAIRVDGLLTEASWRTATPITEFRQREPVEGALSTEATEVRIIAAGDVLYVGVIARDIHPERIVSRILARDKVMETEFDGKPKFAGDDAIAILIDPFHDHRNAFLFATNPNGAEFDAFLTDEGRSTTSTGAASGRWRPSAPPRGGRRNSRFPFARSAITATAARGGSTCTA